MEPSHGSTDDTGESLVVEGAGSRENTEEDKDVEDDHQERGGDANTVVDAEPELNLPMELVRGPPGEPLVHHDGTGLLGGDGEDQSDDHLPPTSGPNVRPPGRTTDGASGNILIMNDVSGGSILGIWGLLRLGGFLPVGVLVSLLSALLNSIDHLAELAILAVELSVGSLLSNGTVVQDDDMVNLGEEAESLGDQETSLAMEGVEETLLEDGASNAWIESSEGVIQQVDVGVGVDSTGQGKTGLLTTGQVSAALDDLTGDTVGETLEISGEGSGTNGTLEALGIHGLAEGDVLLDGGGLDPCLLRAVGDGTVSDDLQWLLAIVRVNG